MPEEGKALPVERIRELIDFMLKSAYGGGARVAAIYPAESMRRSAANSLLKILEEPQPDSYLLLVAENTQPLPATIISRCRLVRVPAVAPDEAIAWLSRQSEGVNWDNAVRLAGGGPLRARELHDQGLDERARTMSGQLAALERRRTTPVEVAAQLEGHAHAVLPAISCSAARSGASATGCRRKIMPIGREFRACPKTRGRR